MFDDEDEPSIGNLDAYRDYHRRKSMTLSDLLKPPPETKEQMLARLRSERVPPNGKGSPEPR